MEHGPKKPLASYDLARGVSLPPLPATEGMSEGEAAELSVQRLLADNLDPEFVADTAFFIGERVAQKLVEEGDVATPDMQDLVDHIAAGIQTALHLGFRMGREYEGRHRA